MNYQAGIAESHHLLAIGLWNAGDIAEAERHIESALFLWQEISNPLRLADSLNIAGTILETKGDRQSALITYDRSQKIFEELKIPRKIATVLNNKATAKKRLGSFEEAVEDYEMATSLSRGAFDPHLTSTILRNYAELLRDRGEFEASQICLEEALQTKKSLEDLLGTTQIMGDIATLSYLRGDVQGAIWFFRESLRIYNNIGSQTGLVFNLHIFARVLVDFGLLNEAKEILNRAESLAEKHQSLAEKAWVDLACGYLEKVEDNIGRARTRLSRALEAARRISDPETVVLAAIILAEIELEHGLSTYDKNAFQSAHNYIEEGKSIAQASGRFYNLVDLLLVESLLLGAQFQFEKAIDRAKEAKNIASRMHLAQLERSQILETILSERKDLAESNKIMALLRAHSTRDLLDFVDLVARRRPSELSIDQDTLFLLAVKVGTPGPVVIFSDSLPKGKDPDELSTSLGVYMATAIGQGGAHRSGLFGPLPAFDLADFEIMVYAASIPDRTQEDERMRGNSYCLFFLIFPLNMRRLLWNRPVLEEVFRKQLQVSDISEITESSYHTLKEELLTKAKAQ